MNGNNACDNSCYRICKLSVFWAVCCAELLTCSAELPPQSSHSDRYSGSLVLSPRAKLKILGKTVEQHGLPDYPLCTILSVLDTNREKLKKNFNFLLILTLYRVCLVGFVKNTCCLLGDPLSSCLVCDPNREKLRENFNFLLILTLFHVCLVGFVKNTCCILGDCSSSCRSFASFISPTQPQAAPHIHEIES